MMALTFFLVIVIVGGMVFWLVALIDSLKYPDQAYTAAGQTKILWVLLIVFLHFIGALIYFVIARPALRRVQTGPQYPYQQSF